MSPLDDPKALSWPREQVTFSSGESGERKGATAGGDGAQAESWGRKYYQKPWAFAKRIISCLVSSQIRLVWPRVLTKGGGPTEAPGRRKEHREGCWGLSSLGECLEERKTKAGEKHHNLSK